MHFLFSIRPHLIIALNVLGVVETTKPDKQNEWGYSSKCDGSEWPVCVVTQAAIHLQHLAGRIMASETFGTNLGLYPVNFPTAAMDTV